VAAASRMQSSCAALFAVIVRANHELEKFHHARVRAYCRTVVA
jgi:hypothetical protein